MKTDWKVVNGWKRAYDEIDEAKTCYTADIVGSVFCKCARA